MRQKKQLFYKGKMIDRSLMKMQVASGNIMVCPRDDTPFPYLKTMQRQRLEQQVVSTDTMLSEIWKFCHSCKEQVHGAGCDR